MTTKQSKRQKITFKFSTHQGGIVRFKGLQFDPEIYEGEELPQPAANLLRAYGFEANTEIEWYDMLSSSLYGLELEEVLEYLSKIVRLFIRSNPQKTKKGKATTAFFVAFDDQTKVQGKDIYDAFTKAFNTWNKNGRPINGVKFKTALQRVLDKINKTRNK